MKKSCFLGYMRKRMIRLMTLLSVGIHTIQYAVKSGSSVVFGRGPNLGANHPNNATKRPPKRHHARGVPTRKLLISLAGA